MISSSWTAFPTPSSLADARIVARLADVTLYVMRAGCVKKRDLAGLQKIWKNGELKRMGIVLCDVEPHGRSSRGYAVYRSLTPPPRARENNSFQKPVLCRVPV